MSNELPMTEHEVSREILATVQRIEAKLDAALTKPTKPVEWRCGCWTEASQDMPSAPPGVACVGCGQKRRWRP